MNLFPVNEYAFKIVGEEIETLERLKRRTELSETLASKRTDKSFLGIIKNNTFKIISSEIGKGALCVLTGEINDKNGEVKVEINKAFQILLTVLLCLPFVGLIIQITTLKENNPLMFILQAVLQLLFIRYFFIEFAFRRFSKGSLNKLRDVLDIEYIEKVR
jgi:hypothetical protein